VCDVDESCSGTHPACPTDAFAPAGGVCRAAAGVCDVGEVCSGSAGACPSDMFAVAGTACPPDGFVCTADVCNGAGACTHPAANAGAICRAASGTCDLAEACDGVSPACPADTGAADADADGTCDAEDACTNVAGAQDFLAAGPKPVLKLSRVGADPLTGNDVLTLKGAFWLPPGATFADVEPLADGARVVLRSAGGAVRADGLLPAGAYTGAGTAGWALNASATTWTFRDGRPGTPSGIAKLSLVHRAPRTPGQVLVRASARRGAFGVMPGDEPLEAIVTLGGAAEAAAGLCGESAFAPAQCRWNSADTTVSCRP